jgi:EAL domain-containing protein (putative c-di-GMP-specific phosphodiesterase class I)
VKAELVADRRLDVLHQPIVLAAAGGKSLSITASIGIAVAEQASAEELLRDADLALYAAKAAGRNRFTLFESTMQTDARDDLEVRMDLENALDADQFFLLYQPIVDLETKEVTGIEALLRWRHPTRGIISPETFIPIAEETGLIVSIGRWVLQTACRQAAEWHQQGHPLNIAVNLSARELDDSDLIHHIQTTLHVTGLDPSSLTVEITETALMRDPEAAAKRLQLLKALGVCIALDDFGTGYSSLAYLRQFPVDAIKIDRSFISGLAVSHESSDALIHTLVELGKALGIQTLGEGIEDHSQLDRLRREHCDFGQGYLFARPLQATAITELLNTNDPTHTTQPINATPAAT